MICFKGKKKAENSTHISLANKTFLQLGPCYLIKLIIILGKNTKKKTIN